MVNFGALTSFALLHLAVIHHYFVRQRTGAWARHLLCPLAGFGVILYVLYGMDHAAKLLGGSWIALGVAYYFVQRLNVRRARAIP